MAERKRYPVGVQTFSNLIEGKYLYVDKTALLYDLINSYQYVFLSRPRRFGKSLTMSTLEAYFRGRKELFKGLAIYDLEREWTKYPVFRFDLSAENFTEPQRLVEHIAWYLKRIEMEYSLSSEGSSIANRFKQLIQQAYEHYGEKVVILVDEYDKPMLDCLHSPGLHDTFKAELRAFYASIKSCDEYIRFAMLTGITKFGKVSIFSGLNNLKDISLLPRYNTLCGISETEFRNYFADSIAEYAEEHRISEEETWDLFKTMYDGYLFATRGENIYNPFSVMNAFDDNEVNSYWYGSGSSTYLVNLIASKAFPLNRLEGEHRRVEELENLLVTDDDIVPLLYQSGYLTIKDYDKLSKEYILGFPNNEVKEAFWNSLAKHFFKGSDGRSAFSVYEFVKDIKEGNPNGFMKRMQSLFADTSSEPERKKEIHFQNMMAIASKMIGLIVRTEVSSSVGRCDMQILTESYVYIFEFKIDGTALEAMEQIHRKGYARPFSSDNRAVFLIGANFSTVTRTIDDNWLIEKL